MTKQQIEDTIKIVSDALEEIPSGAHEILNRMGDYAVNQHLDDFIASYPPLPKNAEVLDD